MCTATNAKATPRWGRLWLVLCCAGGLLAAALVAFADVVVVGFWHPALMAWRTERLVAGFLGRGRQALFERRLASGSVGVPVASYAQGSTPWYVLRQVTGWLALTSSSRFLDVGAGDGLAMAVLARLSGASGVGVEPLRSLWSSAPASWRALGVDLQMVSDVALVPAAECNACYCCWTAFDRSARAGVERALTRLPPGARLVTVTHPPQGPQFKLVGHHRRWFPWGLADMFVAVRT